MASLVFASWTWLHGARARYCCAAFNATCSATTYLPVQGPWPLAGHAAVRVGHIIYLFGCSTAARVSFVFARRLMSRVCCKVFALDTLALELQECPVEFVNSRVRSDVEQENRMPLGLVYLTATRVGDYVHQKRASVLPPDTLCADLLDWRSPAVHI